MIWTLFPGGKRELAPVERMTGSGTARLVDSHRAQVEPLAVNLGGLLPADHVALAVWEVVESLGVSAMNAQIQSVEGGAGLPASTPRIYVAFWLDATALRIGDALARTMERHGAYLWICGDVLVNRHSSLDFWVQQVVFLDRLLTNSMAVLMSQGLATLLRVTQAGMRVRTGPCAASFQSKPRLHKRLKESGEQVKRSPAAEGLLRPGADHG